LSPQEFAALFQRAGRRLWCVAVGIVGDGALAEDIVQDAAAIALEKLGQFDPSTSFNAWMGQIVRFVAMNERRRAGRHKTPTIDPVVLASREDARSAGAASGHGGGAAQDAARAASHPPIDRHGRLNPDQDAFDDSLTGALKDLGEMARACLLLRTVLDLNYAEIAELLAIPEGTAMSHVHRSRQALRARLAGAHGGTR
jgi:RNA polymerase sigma-70 factor (ECF subfamily)